MQGQLAKGQAATKGQVATGDPNPVENPAKDLLYHLTPATDVERGDIKRHRTARLWMLLAEGVERKDIMRKFAYRENALHTLETPQASSAGAGANEPLYFNDEGQPVYTYMVSVPHANKHLIKFPVALKPTALRRKGTNTDSSPSTSTSSVLLKADTGADINLMNKRTFNQLFDSKVLKPTPIRMENYGNLTVKVLGMLHAFLRWKDRVYRQLFYVTDCDRSPNLLSRDACYTLGVLKPCYTVEKTITQKTSPPTVNACAKGDVAPKSSLHQKMKGSEEKLSNNSNKCSTSQSQLKDHPLTKQDILQVYSDVFTRIGKFPGMPYKFQL